MHFTGNSKTSIATRALRSPVIRTTVALLCGLPIAVYAADSLGRIGHAPPPADRDAQLAAYFRAEVNDLETRCLSRVNSLNDWTRLQPVLKRQLHDMLGLNPMPEKSDLNAETTGRIEHPQFTVETLHFQSMPGLFVTANLYVPRNLTEPAPTILYVCGHATGVKDGVRYGNKTAYHHHGAWFARNGYVCLIIDTVHRGEIPGIHHGTYREGMWWWNSRGYTPAGLEAWNGIRALDYLETRPEVDSSRFGITGRSGGGVYSWWVTALDDRIRAAAPVAGITDLRNHVVDGVVEGHCDCMYMVNTYQWDYAQVAALVAPRPLLIENTDRDSIFPLDGVIRLHDKVKRIYDLHDAADHLGLVITPGPHQDTQELRVPAFRWFNLHLKKETGLIADAAEKLFEPESLKTFDVLPEYSRNGTIQETFVPIANPAAPPNSDEQWAAMRKSWMNALETQVFRGWPRYPGPVDWEPLSRRSLGGLQAASFEIISQRHVRYPIVCLQAADGAPAPERVVLHVLDSEEWIAWSESLSAGSESGPNALDLLENAVRGNRAAALMCPRGLGPVAWTGDDRKAVQIRRRFMLLGQTLDGMRVWDIRRAVQALGRIYPDAAIEVRARADQAVNALYASLFEPGITRMTLTDVPASHMRGPDYINVLRFLDIPQALALASQFTEIELVDPAPHVEAYAAAASRAPLMPIKVTRNQP